MAKSNEQRLKDVDFLVDAPASGQFFQTVAQAVLERRVPLFDANTGKVIGETSLASLAGWQNGTSVVMSRETAKLRQDLAATHALVAELAGRQNISKAELEELLEKARASVEIDAPETLVYTLQDVNASDGPAPEKETEG